MHSRNVPLMDQKFSFDCIRKLPLNGSEITNSSMKHHQKWTPEISKSTADLLWEIIKMCSESIRNILGVAPEIYFEIHLNICLIVTKLLMKMHSDMHYKGSRNYASDMHWKWPQKNASECHLICIKMHQKYASKSSELWSENAFQKYIRNAPSPNSEFVSSSHQGSD